jgi:flagellar protein FlaI
MDEGESRVINFENKYFYKIELPSLSPNEMKFLNSLKNEAVEAVNLEGGALTEEQRKQNVLFEVLKIIDKSKSQIDLSEKKKHELGELVVNDLVGYSLLEPLLEDDNIEEIMVIGPKSPVYVYHRKFGMLESNVIFQDPDEIIKIAHKIASRVGRKIDKASPLLDARLSDGSRVNATLSPPGVDGSTITIRKFKRDPLTIIDLIKFNTLSSEFAAFLWVMVDGMGAWQKNVIIAGGTGSGKTTTLNALTIFIRGNERVITIEDTAELQIPLKHLIRFESRAPNVDGKGEINMDALVKNTLRMRPDRIIIGEVRGEEARSLFTAMNTGHNGNFATLHANNSRECMTRLTNNPMNVPTIMIPALDLVIMQARLSRGNKGSIRRIVEVTEIGGVTDDIVGLSKIYEWIPGKDELRSTGTPSKLKQDLAKQVGIPLKEINDEVERRKLIIDYLLEENIREFSQVRKWVEDYYDDSEATLEKIEETFITHSEAAPQIEN